MKQNLKLLVVLIGGAVLGAAIAYFPPSTKPRDQGTDFDFAIIRRDEPGLSPVLFWGHYMKAKSSVEIRYDGRLTLIDGEIFSGESLAGELTKKRETKKANYLIVVGDDLDRYGVLVERVESFRRLGFAYVVLMSNRTWTYDEKTHDWKRTR